MFKIITKDKVKEIKKSKLGHSRGHIPEKYEMEFFGKRMFESDIVKSKTFDGRYYVIGIKNHYNAIPESAIKYADNLIEDELAKRAWKLNKALDLACDFIKRKFPCEECGFHTPCSNKEECVECVKDYFLQQPKDRDYKFCEHFVSAYGKYEGIEVDDE